jgi:PleD family two-component response regulator
VPVTAVSPESIVDHGHPEQPLCGRFSGETSDVAPYTVFVVEDDLDTRDMLGRFLELEGYKVELAANGDSVEL